MEVWGGSDSADAAVTLSGLDAWVYARPFAQADAGGDVYYVSACATGRINRLLVADVSGHGDGVRGVARQLRDLMRRYVNYLDQSAFVVAMNRRFVECSAAGCFATAVVSTFFAPTRTLTVCNAGHPPPLVYRAATGAWSFLDRAAESAADRCVNLPLGIMEYEYCEQFAVQLDVGDLVLVYTDSLTEARRDDAAREMLGMAGLLAAVTASADPTKPETLIPTLLRAIDGQTNGGLRADDVTALLLRPNGTGTESTFLRGLAAPFRILAQPLTGHGPLALPQLSLASIGGAFFPAFSRRWGRRPPAR
jgi:serine phosphatase RsbU (regulator of sigma subunit)